MKRQILRDTEIKRNHKRKRDIYIRGASTNTTGEKIQLCYI